MNAKGFPVFPVAIILIVLAGVGYGVYSASNDDDEPGESTTVVQNTPRPTVTVQASAEFTSPLDGATVSNPVTVTMAIGGLRFAPAGDTSQLGNGHLHVFIDSAPPPANQVIEAGPAVIDLDDGGHEVVLPELAPGTHTLTLVWGNPNHTVRFPEVTDTIQITVE